jgi:superfamily II RNA helicase
MQSDEEIKKELSELKEMVQRLAITSNSAKQIAEPENQNADVSYLMKIVEERERTNGMLRMIMERVRNLEQQIIKGNEQAIQQSNETKQVLLSDVDAKIINYASMREMVCADEIRELMGYKGNNAACSRLNKLYKAGLLNRFQLGHVVYYKFDAGKATKMLIISPPQ